jgi:hypothetical protein
LIDIKEDNGGGQPMVVVPGMMYSIFFSPKPSQ